jgi:mannose-6-phosphate isomerase-like protein (cupin superfamily)
MANVVKIGRDVIPPVELSTGMGTRYNVCQETVGTELLRMGVCHHAADMADMAWEGKSEEAFYVAKGSIKVVWENDRGERGEVVAREGEQLYLPRGNRYILRATGEPAINIFAIAGPPTHLTALKGGEASRVVKTAAARLFA